MLLKGTLNVELAPNDHWGRVTRLKVRRELLLRVRLLILWLTLEHKDSFIVCFVRVELLLSAVDIQICVV